MAAKLCLKDTPEVRYLTRARIPLYNINKAHRRVTVVPNSKQFHAEARRLPEEGAFPKKVPSRRKRPPT
jgi:hypothetical protein